MFFKKVYRKQLTPRTLAHEPVNPFFVNFAVGRNSFRVTDACISCGLCERICPTKTITLSGSKPVWTNTCIQCVACIHRCPVRAIEYGKATLKKGRYHHPDMRVKIGNDGETITVENSPVNDLFLGNAGKVFEEGYDIDSLVAKYPTSPAAAFYLYRYFTYQLSLDELKATRDRLSPSLGTCPYVVDLDGIIRQLENMQIGKTAPEFSLPDTAGVSVSLSDFRGKYVLLDFWASWCPPCRRENPNLVKAFQEYKDKNFTILGISLDQDKAKWQKAIADDELTWTHVSDLKYWDSEIPALYGVRGIPANVLLDPDGVIIARNVTGEALHQTLQDAIK